jgi:hypothetical protein
MNPRYIFHILHAPPQFNHEFLHYFYINKHIYPKTIFVMWLRTNSPKSPEREQKIK